MKLRSPAAILCVLASLPILAAAEPERPEQQAKPQGKPENTVNHREVSFSAFGCGPYQPRDEEAIRFYIARENAVKTADFLIHLGDINSGAAARAGEVTEPYYLKIRELLSKENQVPTYIVPGDNEWNDQLDPNAAWGWWSKHLQDLDKQWKTPWKTSRQESRPENFAFVHGGVLFIGLNLVGGRVHDGEEWQWRFRQDNEWVAAQFKKHGPKVRAAVVCCQANVVGMGRVKKAVNLLFAPFCQPFTQECIAFKKPVLFLHSDGHVWLDDKPWPNAPNVRRVQIDRSCPEFPPLKVTIRKAGDDPFVFDRRLKAPGWRAPNRKKDS